MINSPIILFFENIDEEHEKIIHKQVWNFNQAPIIFIIKHNRVLIYNGFDFDKKESFLKKIDKSYEYFSFENFYSSKLWKEVL